MTDLRYPFAAIVGQERVKMALLYNLIEPRIGGVLLCGEKGTAKSTIVRGMAALTDQSVVDLPLSITEDMLVGAIDFERAVKEGKKEFSGGLLQRAHENILYVDEVNLLPDGIVSTLICAAASGENLVEREGISYRHACRFVLIGTMNPEEGKLRPQFLDRFGLYADVVGEPDLELRTEIIRRRMEYERDPASFCQSWKAAGEELRRRLVRARELVEQVEADASIRTLAGKYALQAGTEGNRCEVVLIRTAAAVAAWNGRDYITTDDLKEAAVYVLPHRQRREPPPPQEQPPGEPECSEEPLDDQTPESSGEQNSEPEQNYEEQDGNDGEEIDTPPPVMNENGGSEEEQLVEGEEISILSVLPAIPRDRVLRQGSGRRSKTKSGTNKGRYAGFTDHPTPRQHDLALDATLRVAAPYQRSRDHSQCAVALTDSDLRYKVRENHVGATIVFVVDASGSMGAQKRMKAAKEAILSMLLDSYQKRDKIGLVAFRKDGAETLLDITASVDLAQKKLQQLPTGGRTPLAAGLYQSWQLLKARRLKDPEMLPMLVLVTDGRANKTLWTEDPVADALRAAELICQEGIHAIVIDTEKDFISLHIAEQLAKTMGAVYYKVDELKAEQLKTIVKSRTSLVGMDG
jgi:magnesium chelatase subunit D